MLLKDPLVHFLLVGAALFALFVWRGEGEGDPEQIVIDANRVRQLSRSAALVQGREPTREELEQLVEPEIREEVYYREALALGLDENDDEVRRRLVEKMRYLTEDIADPEPASEEALREFYAASPERFVIPASVTFDQVFFSPNARGEALETDVAAGLQALRDGAAAEEIGDRTPLESRFMDAARDRVAVLFGAALTDAVFALPEGEWSGPYESDFGLHLVRVVSRSAARRPSYDEAREQVAQTFAADRRSRANAQAYAQMRARYDVVVEWPEAGAEALAQ